MNKPREEDGLPRRKLTVTNNCEEQIRLGATGGFVKRLDNANEESCPDGSVLDEAVSGIVSQFRGTRQRKSTEGGICLRCYALAGIVLAHPSARLSRESMTAIFFISTIDSAEGFSTGH